MGFLYTFYLVVRDTVIIFTLFVLGLELGGLIKTKLQGKDRYPFELRLLWGIMRFYPSRRLSKRAHFLYDRWEEKKNHG